MNYYAISDTIKNQAFITPWALIHFLSGGIAFFTIMYLYPNISMINALLLWFILHTIYEIKDLMPFLKKKKYPSEWEDNSVINSIGDTLFSIIGFLFFSLFGRIKLPFVVIYSILVLFLVISFNIYG